MESLENICFNSVLKNLKHFIIEYKSGNRIPKKHFEFLQRRYSKLLLSQLLSSNVDDSFQYFEFLLNPYIREIDLSALEYSHRIDIASVVEQLKQIGKTIKFLRVSGYIWHEKALLELTSSLTDVESLSIRDTQATKEVLSSIRKNCCRLRTLDMTSLCNKDVVLECSLSAISSFKICRTLSWLL